MLDQGRDVLTALAKSPRKYAAELQQTTVETNSDVAETLDDLRRFLVDQRAELVAAAERLGVGIAGAGTMPLSLPLQMTETARFRELQWDNLGKEILHVDFMRQRLRLSLAQRNTITRGQTQCGFVPLFGRVSDLQRRSF